MNIFHIFFYKSLASGALILEIMIIADNKPMDFCYVCYFFTYFLIRSILKYIEIQIENNSFIFKQNSLISVPVKCKYSKLIFIQFNLKFNVYYCVCFCGKIIAHLITTWRTITQYYDCNLVLLLLIYCLTLKTPITTKIVCFVVCGNFRSLFNKQCRPRSDCSYRSSLIWVHTVCLK